MGGWLVPFGFFPYVTCAVTRLHGTIMGDPFGHPFGIPFELPFCEILDTTFLLKALFIETYLRNYVLFPSKPLRCWD